MITLKARNRNVCKYCGKPADREKTFYCEGYASKEAHIFLDEQVTLFKNKKNYHEKCREKVQCLLKGDLV